MSLRTRQSPRRRWTLAFAAGSATLLMVAGCGSGGEGGSSDPGQTSSGAPEGMSAYLDCLRGQGIDIPTAVPSGRPTAFPSGRPTAFPSGRPTAFPSGRPTAFPSGRPTAFPPGGPGGGRMDGFRPQGVDDATWQKAQGACASQRPSGGPGGNGPRGGNREADAAYRNCLADRGVDLRANPATADPKVAEAMQACKVLRPTATATH
ncbi:hypothetical protein O7614_21430 [Micromonospora sp. WMMD961]|uniref:hypothetical protein n=1 Tax=Micromonospora sp. WMMD961 TaxID=3016100 RepID=UPI0024178CCB|nr:hypothetical protein [Micromonospora sp. WMMD961]MDG4782226.1 hypothetical protein [Micromonospora sp. WMMD961]